MSDVQRPMRLPDHLRSVRGRNLAVPADSRTFSYDFDLLITPSSAEVDTCEQAQQKLYTSEQVKYTAKVVQCNYTIRQVLPLAGARYL